ncbi:MAG: TonB-dependent receptor plug domain-containing protein, partial [Gemmatimonadetes bacterium]|nr:TonB-dependent receptor plug domain-containing protein [Gemmatimonadota bacterium]
MSGRILERGGLVVAGATVSLAGTGVRTLSGPDGRYRLTGLREGRYRLEAAASGRGPAAIPLHVTRAGEILRRDLVLDAVRLPEVLTLVERAPAEVMRHVLRRSDLARAGSLPAALSRVPGVFVKAFGAGGAREVSIRGAGPEQTLVLWGDERLLAPGGGAVDLASLPAAGIDSVEVITHGASHRFGSGALGGVVRIHAGGAGGVTPRHFQSAFELASPGARAASAGLTLPLAWGALEVAGG